jgi:hypothetical protein
MFEEIITALQGMNIGFEEMPEQGMLSVEVGQMDKMQLIEVLNMVYSMGMTVSALNESSMSISSGQPTTPEEPVISPVEEETTDEDAQNAALDEALAGM